MTGTPEVQTATDQPAVTVTDQQPVKMSDEQAAEFAALNQGAVVTEAIPGQPAAAPVEVKVPLDQEIGGLVSAAVAMFKPAFPSLEKIYTPETIESASGAVAAVCNKHGWLQGGIGGEYAEEIAAAFVLVPLAIVTRNGIQADMAAREESEPAQPGQPDKQEFDMSQPSGSAVFMVGGKPVENG